MFIASADTSGEIIAPKLLIKTRAEAADVFFSEGIQSFANARNSP